MLVCKLRIRVAMLFIETTFLSPEGLSFSNFRKFTTNASEIDDVRMYP